MTRVFSSFWNSFYILFFVIETGNQSLFTNIKVFRNQKRYIFDPVMYTFIDENVSGE